MAGDNWFQQLEEDLAHARRTGLTDQQLAYGLMAIRAGQALEPALEAHSDLVWRMVWVLHVRAPGLNPRWLLEAVLDLDKVYWGALPLVDLLARVAAQEQAASSAHGDPDAWLTRSLHQDQAELAALRSAAADAGRIFASAGRALREQVRADLAQVQTSVERGDLLQLATGLDPQR